MTTRKTSLIDPDGRLAERVEAIKADFLARRWARYLELVRRLEAHPENRDGADKTWVARATEAYREHYRQAVRIR